MLQALTKLESSYSIFCKHNWLIFSTIVLIDSFQPLDGPLPLESGSLVIALKPLETKSAKIPFMFRLVDFFWFFSCYVSSTNVWTKFWTHKTAFNTSKCNFHCIVTLRNGNKTAVWHRDFFAQLKIFWSTFGNC